VPVKNISIDESTVGFNGKILFKTYNPKKPTKWGLGLFVLADSEIGYVNSIIPYYGKVTGDICNLPYPEKSFTRRIVLSLITRVGEPPTAESSRYLVSARPLNNVRAAFSMWSNPRLYNQG
jgi:hypothetical protein